MTHAYTFYWNIWFWAATGISLVNASAAVLIYFEESFIIEVTSGWMISFCNHLAQTFLNPVRKLRVSSQNTFQSLGWTGLRAGLFLLIITFIVLTRRLVLAPFIYAVFSTYFIFLFYNVLCMHFESLQIKE